MAEHGKRYQDAVEAGRPHAGLPDRRGGRAGARDVQRQVRRIGRGPPPPRRRPPARRPDGPRHRRPAARHRQGRPRRRLRPGREGPGGAARRRRRGRRRGPGQEDRGRLARVRRRARDARHDGHGRPPRPDPRPPRPDAEPQVRHDHVRPRPGHPRGQVAAASSSRSTRARSSTSPSARRASRPTSWPRTWPALVDAINRAKPAGAKGQYLRTLTIATHDGPRASASTSRASSPPRRRSRAYHRPLGQPVRLRGSARERARSRLPATRRVSRTTEYRRIAADSLRPRTPPPRGR